MPKKRSRRKRAPAHPATKALKKTEQHLKDAIRSAGEIGQSLPKGVSALLGSRLPILTEAGLKPLQAAKDQAAAAIRILGILAAEVGEKKAAKPTARKRRAKKAGKAAAPARKRKTAKRPARKRPRRAPAYHIS